MADEEKKDEPLPKLVWISDSPKMMGVGQSRVTREVLSRWHGTVYDVEAIGYGHDVENVPLACDPASIPYPVHPMNREDFDKIVEKLVEIKPAYVMLSHDPWLFPTIANARVQLRDTIFVGYITVDSAPPNPGWRNVLECYDGIVSPSPFGAKALLDRWFDLPVDVVPYGVDLETFKAPTTPKAEVKEEVYKGTIDAALNGRTTMLLDPRDKFTACFLGQNTLRKNCAASVEAWREFEKGKDDVYCIFMAHSFSFLQEKNMYPPSELARADTLVLVGQILDDSQIAQLYAMSDVLLHTVTCEGFGLTLLEAMACGAVPITTNYSAMADVCNDEVAYMVDGVGYPVFGGAKVCVPPVGNIVDALEEAYADWKDGHLETKQQAGIEYVKHFPWDRTAKELAEKNVKFKEIREARRHAIVAVQVL